MTSPGIADFLLARIADDERVWGNGAFAPVAGQGLSRLVLKTRAECEAKRRIVELHRTETEQRWVHELDGPDHQETEYSCVICGWFPPGSACDTLRLLALPYADHPDYRDEWRP